MTSGVNAKGRFGKQNFVHVAADDLYLWRAGERLVYHFTNEEDGKTLRRYWTTACQACALKSKCTTGNERRISRWEHEAVLEAMQARLDRNPCACAARRSSIPSARQILDGSDALPDENTQARQYRNGTARPGKQHEAGNEHFGRWRIEWKRSEHRIIPSGTGSCRPTLNIRVFCTAWTPSPTFGPSDLKCHLSISGNCLIADPSMRSVPRYKGGEESVIGRRWTDQTMDFWRSGGNMFPRQRR
jgi:hypothetical protein